MNGDTTKFAPVSHRDGLTTNPPSNSNLNVGFFGSMPIPISFATLPPSIVEFPAVTYEEKVSRGIELMERKEKCQWDIGDLALSLMQSTQISTDMSLARFAPDIGLKPSTLQSYVRMSRYWLPDERHEWPNLRYSHYKSAMNAYLMDKDKAIEAMEHASLLGLSVASFDGYLRERKAEEQGVISQRELLLSDLLARAFYIMQGLVGSEQEIMDEIRGALGLRLDE